MNQLTNNIKAFRKAKKLSQNQLAAKIGVHLTHVNRIENGKYKPSVEDLIKLAEVFEVSVDDLLNGSANKKPSEDVIKNTPLHQKIKLIEELDEHDKNTILNVIDSLLTKRKFKDFFQQQLA